MKEKLSILFLEDDPATIRLVSKLRHYNYVFQIHAVRNRTSFVAALQAEKYDCIIIDYVLADIDGISALKIVSELTSKTPAIIYTGSVGEEKVVECMKAGAIDFILKSQPDQLVPAVISAVKYRHLVEDRRRAEDAVRESERRYQTLTEMSPVGIFHTDNQGSTIYVNPRWSEISGLDAKRALGTGWLAVVHPDDRQSVASDWEAAVKNKIISTREYRFLRPDEKVVWVFSQATPEYNLEGALTGYIGTITDITERKKAENDLRRTKNFAESLIQTANVIFVQLDSAGNVVRLNDVSEKIFGYSQAELVGKNWFDTLVPKERYPYVWEEFKKLVVYHDIINEFENPIITKSGEERYITWRNSVLYEEDRFCGTISFGIDITERKRIEETLRSSEQKFNQAFRSSPVAIVIQGMDDTFIDVNDAFVKMTGYTLEDLSNFQPSKPKIWDNPDERAFAQELLVKDGYLRNFEFTFRKKSGECGIGLISAEYTEMNGAHCVLSIALDITPRKQAEEALQESEERFRHISSTISDISYSCVTDEDGTYSIDWMTGAAERITGYSIDEIKAKRCWGALIIKDDFPLFKKHVLRLDPGSSSTCELCLQHKNGGNVWVASYAECVKELGHPGRLRIYGGLVDISERKRAELLLESQNALLTALINSPSDIAIFSVDRNYCYTTFNKKHQEEMERVCNVDIKIGMNMFECMWIPELRTAAKISIDRALKGEAFSEIQHQIRLDIYYEVSWNPIYQNKEIVGVTVFKTDITEREQAEKALWESVRQISLIYDTVGDAIFNLTVEKDGSYRFTSVNQCFLSTTGLNANQVVGKLVQEVIPGPSLTLVFEKYAEAIRQKKIVRWEEISEYPTGRLIGEVSIAPVFDDSNKCVGLVGSVHDITVRMRTEEALREREQLFRGLFNASPDAIVLIDPHHPTISWPIVDCNEAACQMNGYTREELIGQSIDVLNTTIGLPEERIAYLKKLRQEGTIHIEASHRQKNGHVFPIEVSTSIVTIGGREMVLGIDRDITERKKAETSLRDSEERYRRLVEFSPDPVIVHSEGKIVYANPAAFKLVGAENPSEFIGRPVLDIVHPEYKDFVRQRVTSGFEQGIARPVEEEKFLKLDGTIIDVEVAALPIIFEGKPAMQVVVRDMTEQKKLQAQLLQAQKMDAIGRLAGGVAHDFNNMIGVILGYASLLEEQIPQSDPSHLKVKYIITAAERSANLTRQLLAFARKQIITPIPLDLNEELISLQKMIGTLTGEDIRFKIHPQQNLWTIKIDPTQITQIVTNLATNARDAIENIGTITIETSNMTIDGTNLGYSGEIPPGEYVCLVFSDTGKGMDEVIKQHIFEPFFTTKPKGEGTGLGLSTVFGIVKQNNGFINVYSELEHGTTFKIYFPRFYGNLETSQKPDDISKTGTESILVVEDEEELMNLVTSELEAFGYKVISVKSPSKALALCKGHGHKINLLITDVVMPGMNGKELKKRIESVYPKIKTLFMSGYTADIVAHRGILDKGVNFLQKPFTPQLLAKKVREVLDKT